MTDERLRFVARLLSHWRHHTFEDVRPFFCQVEAVETMIWLTEVERLYVVVARPARLGGDRPDRDGQIDTGHGHQTVELFEPSSPTRTPSSVSSAPCRWSRTTSGRRRAAT